MEKNNCADIKKENNKIDNTNKKNNTANKKNDNNIKNTEMQNNKNIKAIEAEKANEQGKSINIIGGGLAGCEAAYYLAKKGYNINLFESKFVQKNPAQKLDLLCELVCSNSLKSTNNLSASGMLKCELEMLDSFLIKSAKLSKVSSGDSLSVNREEFAKIVTQGLKNFKNITIKSQIVESFDVNIPTIVAAGPLCESKLFTFLANLVGDKNCYFYDAIAPIIETDSIDMTKAFWGNRYQRGETQDFLNCILYEEDYDVFYNNLISAETVALKSFEEVKVYEGCMPVEIMAKRGYHALRFGPMKPRGLCRGAGDKKPYAIVQLRKEDNNSNYLNMVGFQTNLTFGEQKRVFSLIPALKNANFARYGTMHRNSYINSPSSLNNFAQLKNFPNIFVAGQISGVEGYVESISSGLYAAINMDKYLKGEELVNFGSQTFMGALQNYIATASQDNFQPMSANYSIIKIDKEFKNKDQKREYVFENSKKRIQEIKNIIQ